MADMPLTISQTSSYNFPCLRCGFVYRTDRRVQALLNFEDVTQKKKPLLLPLALDLTGMHEQLRRDTAEAP